MTQNEIIGIVFGSILLLGLVVCVVLCIVLGLLEYNAVRAKNLEKENSKLISEKEYLIAERKELIAENLSFKVDIMNLSLDQIKKANSVIKNESKK